MSSALSPTVIATAADIVREMSREALEDSERWFPELPTADIVMKVLCLSGEVGELANEVKKVERGDFEYDEKLEAMRSEIADIFTYLLDLCAALNVDLVNEYYKKRAFNEQRFGNREGSNG